MPWYSELQFNGNICKVLRKAPNWQNPPPPDLVESVPPPALQKVFLTRLMIAVCFKVASPPRQSKSSKHPVYWKKNPRWWQTCADIKVTTHNPKIWDFERRNDWIGTTKKSGPVQPTLGAKFIGKFLRLLKAVWGEMTISPSTWNVIKPFNRVSFLFQPSTVLFLCPSTEQQKSSIFIAFLDIRNSKLQFFFQKLHLCFCISKRKTTGSIR